MTFEERNVRNGSKAAAALMASLGGKRTFQLNHGMERACGTGRGPVRNNRAAEVSWSVALAATGLACVATAAEARDPSLAAVTAASAKFQDVNVAKAEGYTTDGKCMSAAMIGYPASAGAMGLHYVRKDLIGISPPLPGKRVSGTNTHKDFLQPSMLVYEPQADGSLKLIAIENLVFDSAWRAAGHKQPPMFHGVPYVLLKDDPATKLDEAHNYESHYELHVWAFRPNHSGMFKEFNPQVTCHYNKAPEKHM
jgi:hypothetical protein